MGESQILYRMNRLMKYTEIEAFAAQTNAGSRIEYFALLTEFIQTSPVLIREMIEARTLHDPDLFQAKVFGLQKALLAVGATSLLLEAEKTVEFARRREWETCAERTAILVPRIKRLRDKLLGARVDPGAAPENETASETVILAMTQGAGDPGRPRVPVEPEVFEKLRPSIENFETDQALDLLRDLMAASYTNTIDSILAELYDSLSRFEHDLAELQFNRLLRHAKAVKRNAGKDERMRILAIDDMPDILVTVKEILKSDYAVYGAANHATAMKILAAVNPDLILLDIAMPGKDGFATLEIIRGIEEHKTTPVLFLSGSISVENIIKSRNAGGNDFIKKPIDPQVLFSKIKKHLD